VYSWYPSNSTKMDFELSGAYCCERESLFSCKSSLKLPKILKILLAEKCYLKFSFVKHFMKIRNGFSECYVLNVTRIDKLTDVQSDRKNASQETNASKIDIRGYKNCRKRKQPAHFSWHSD